MYFQYSNIFWQFFQEIIKTKILQQKTFGTKGAQKKPRKRELKNQLENKIIKAIEDTISYNIWDN